MIIQALTVILCCIVFTPICPKMHTILLLVVDKKLGYDIVAYITFPSIHLRNPQTS